MRLADICNMSDQLPSNASPSFLRRHLDTSALRKQLLAQIEKDLELETLNISTDETPFFEDLKDELVVVLRHFMEHDAHRLPNLIYRVDLHELKVKQLLANPEVDAAKGLADEIIFREMKKVFYRNVYSGNIQI